MQYTYIYNDFYIDNIVSGTLYTHVKCIYTYTRWYTFADKLKLIHVSVYVLILVLQDSNIFYEFTN